MTNFSDLGVLFDDTVSLEQRRMITDAFNLYANSSFAPNTDTFAQSTATKISFYTDVNAFNTATGQSVDPTMKAGFTSKYHGGDAPRKVIARAMPESV
jgi:hypothetical protein